MGKGVLARQNLALLRYARAAGMLVTWNLLTGFPGDKREDYDSTLALIPLIRHLPPPMWVSRAVLSRFSSYANKPDAYGITGLRPPRSYAWIFPSHADLESLASQYDGDFACAHNSYPELQVALEQAHREWREGWKVGAPAPALHLTPGNEGYYTLLDTRGLEGTAMFQLLDEEQARAVLIGGPLERQRLASWAIERKLAVALDGWCAPLATTDVETWRRWEARTPEEVQNALATPV